MCWDMSTTPIQFLHEPRTEQEVVCLFVALLEHIDDFPKPIVIERVHEAFPDCTIRAAGARILIEFKLYAESYNHALDGSVIVCWKKGKERRWPKDTRIVELAPVVAARRPDLLISNDDTYCTGPWCAETFFAVATREGTSASVIETMREITRWADAVGFGPIWKRDPKPQFDVGYGEPYFTVWSDGKFRLVVKRFRAGEALTDLVEELKRAAPSLDLSLSSLTSKRRIPLGEHLADSNALTAFLETFERFAGRLKSR